MSHGAMVSSMVQLHFLGQGKHIEIQHYFIWSCDAFGTSITSLHSLGQDD